jgi:hypothetical protein
LSGAPHSPERVRSGYLHAFKCLASQSRLGVPTGNAGILSIELQCKVQIAIVIDIIKSIPYRLGSTRAKLNRADIDSARVEFICR